MYDRVHVSAIRNVILIFPELSPKMCVHTKKSDYFHAVYVKLAYVSCVYNIHTKIHCIFVCMFVIVGAIKSIKPVGQGIPLHHFHLTGPTQLQYESTSNANTPSIHCILLLCVLCILCTLLMSIVHLYIVYSGPKYDSNYFHSYNINYYYLGIKTKYFKIDLKYFTSGEVVLDPEKGPRGLIGNLIRNNKKQRSGIFLKIITQ